MCLHITCMSRYHWHLTTQAAAFRRLKLSANFLVFTMERLSASIWSHILQFSTDVLELKLHKEIENVTDEEEIALFGVDEDDEELFSENRNFFSQIPGFVHGVKLYEKRSGMTKTLSMPQFPMLSGRQVLQNMETRPLFMLDCDWERRYDIGALQFREADNCIYMAWVYGSDKPSFQNSLISAHGHFTDTASRGCVWICIGDIIPQHTVLQYPNCWNRYFYNLPKLNPGFGYKLKVDCIEAQCAK